MNRDTCLLKIVYDEISDCDGLWWQFDLMMADSDLGPVIINYLVQ